jgi:hypothetical protein
MRVKAIEQFFARANYPHFPYLYPLLCFAPFHASHLPRHGLKNIYRPHQASFSFDSVSSLGLSQQLTVCRRGKSRYTEHTIKTMSGANRWFTVSKPMMVAFTTAATLKTGPPSHKGAQQ